MTGVNVVGVLHSQPLLLRSLLPWLQVTDLIAISDNAYVREHILVMEKIILGKLVWYMTVPTPYVFLVRYIKASVPADWEMEMMAFFIAELAFMYYPTVIYYCPSMLAAAAVCAARCTLYKSPSPTETLKHHTGYSEEQLMDCAKMLVSFQSRRSREQTQGSVQQVL